MFLSQPPEVLSFGESAEWGPSQGQVPRAGRIGAGWNWSWVSPQPSVYVQTHTPERPQVSPWVGTVYTGPLGTVEPPCVCFSKTPR